MKQTVAVTNQSWVVVVCNMYQASIWLFTACTDTGYFNSVQMLVKYDTLILFWFADCLYLTAVSRDKVYHKVFNWQILNWYQNSSKSLHL